MRALLLAGGLGTRLRPLTETVPKCLVPVHGKPLLDTWLDLLFDGGIERALVNTHWLAPVVEAHVASSRWCDRIDLVHERELLGTGGTILANRTYFDDRPFVVAHADNLVSFSLDKLLAAHLSRPSRAVMTMLAFETDVPSSCGILECDGEGLVVGFHEKVANPPGTLANGAVYVIEPEVVAFITSLGRTFVDFSTDVIPAFTGRILAWRTDGYHRDIGSSESLARAHREFPRPATTVLGPGGLPH